MDSLSFDISWNIFISPSVLKLSFAHIIIDCFFFFHHFEPVFYLLSGLHSF
jgi:hypothetical protein